MKTVPLDEETEKRYQQEIDKWQQMDSAQTRAIEIMANEIKDLSAKIETLSVENRQQLAEMLDKQDEVIKEVKNVPQNSKLYYHL
jgi:predicted  nucleic acid-binding Zn-ribbon protein